MKCWCCKRCKTCGILDQWGAALDISVDEFTQVGFLLETLTLTVDSSRRKDLSKS